MEKNNEGRNDLLRMNSFAPLIAGISGGTVSTVLLLPLDNIKVRMQVNEETTTTNKKKTSISQKTTTASASSVKRTNKTSYPILRFRSISLIRGIVRHEGIIGLYQGLTPAVIGSALAWGGYFYLYEGMKTNLKVYKQKLELNSIENFQLACTAGAVMVFITNPFWLLKLRMQLQMKKHVAKQQQQQHLTVKQPYKNMYDAAKTIIKEEGILALYKGTAPALLLTSHGGVQFVVYEFLRKHFHAQRHTTTTITPTTTNQKQSQSVLKRLELSFGYLTIGAIAKMYVHKVFGNAAKALGRESMSRKQCCLVEFSLDSTFIRLAFFLCWNRCSFFELFFMSFF